MYKKVSILLVALIALGLMIGLPFSFNNEAVVNNTAVLIFYIISKSVFGLIFIFAVLWSVSTRARGSIYLLLLVATLLQGFPALCRASLFMDAFTLPFNILMIALGLIVFVVVFMMNSWTSKTQVASDEKYVGKEIPIQEEKVTLDDKGE
jgi:hypothetical protein